MKELVFLFLSFAATSNAFAADDLSDLTKCALNNTPSLDQQFTLLEEEKRTLEKEKEELAEKEKLIDKKFSTLRDAQKYINDNESDNERLALYLQFLLMLSPEEVTKTISIGSYFSAKPPMGRSDYTNTSDKEERRKNLKKTHAKIMHQANTILD